MVIVCEHSWAQILNQRLHSLCQKSCPGNSFSTAVCPQGNELIGCHAEVNQVFLYEETPKHHDYPDTFPCCIVAVKLNQQVKPWYGAEKIFFLLKVLSSVKQTLRQLTLMVVFSTCINSLLWMHVEITKEKSSLFWFLQVSTYKEKLQWAVNLVFLWPWNSQGYQ